VAVSDDDGGVDVDDDAGEEPVIGSAGSSLDRDRTSSRPVESAGAELVGSGESSPSPDTEWVRSSDAVGAFDREPDSDADELSAVAGWNWNLLPPQSGQPESISFDPSANTRSQVVHWWGIDVTSARRAR
jgi:hypothetical protein